MEETSEHTVICVAGASDALSDASHRIAAMLGLGVAFFLLFVAAYYVLIHPRIRSHSAKIGHQSVAANAADTLCAEAFEFCDGSEGDAAPRVLVVYATEYGFAREVARKTAAYLARAHVDVGPALQYPAAAPRVRARVVNALNFTAIDFTREALLLFVCSTTGDGVPPNEAEALHDALRDGALALPGTLHYGVLALGDSGYPHFCRGGKIFDELLHHSEARCVMPRVDVDQEDWDVVLGWMRKVDAVVAELPTDPQPDYLDAALRRVAAEMSTGGTRYSRANAYRATLVTRIPLCRNPPRKIVDPKHVIRVEFEIDPNKLSYTPGDAVGVLPQNNPEAVNAILKLLAANGDERVVLDGPEASEIELETALMEKLDLRVIRPELVQALGDACTAKVERALHERLVEHTGNGVALTDTGRDYVRVRHVVDVLSDFGSAQLGVRRFARLLRPLQTRYYSISSNEPTRVAATLDVVRYCARGVRREGVASTYLSDRVRLDDSVKIFISRNADFRLPVDGGRPILMIGAGTGIAPYIAFMKERVERGAQGTNVLYFGCRHRDHDFLYDDLLQSWVARGDLELHAAFSRDQEHKVYVQNLIRRNATQVWALLQCRAHVYVCGDGNQMARDVHDALRDVVLQCGDVGDVQQAQSYLDELQSDRRYQRDVWVS